MCLDVAVRLFLVVRGFQVRLDIFLGQDDAVGADEGLSIDLSAFAEYGEVIHGLIPRLPRIRIGFLPLVDGVLARRWDLLFVQHERLFSRTGYVDRAE